MADERPLAFTQSEPTLALLPASVQPNHDGGWLTTVNLGDGASLTKWFASHDEALRYPEELAAWLRRGRE